MGECLIHKVSEQGALLNRCGFSFEFNQPAIRLGFFWKVFVNEGMLCEWNSHVPLSPNMEIDILNQRTLMLRPWLPEYAHVRAQVDAWNFPNQ